MSQLVKHLLSKSENMRVCVRFTPESTLKESGVIIQAEGMIPRPLHGGNG